MNHNTHRIVVRPAALLAFAALGLAPAAPAAAEAPATRPEQAQGRLTVSPQAITPPELRWQLLPRRTETRPGIAAVKYLEAVAELPAQSDAELDEINAWRTIPLADLHPKDPHTRAMMQKFSNALRFSSDAALLETPGWQTHVREKGVAALLPALGKFRRLSNVLAVQARLDIKAHDWPAAQRRLQTGFMLARHIGEGETLVESLVAVAVAQQMTRVLDDWISEPGAPNLYWPLSNLPSPFVDLQRTMSFEREFAYFTLPAMRDMRAGRHSAATWSQLVAQMSDVTGTIGITSTGTANTGGSLLPLSRQQLLAGLGGAALYPEAKQFLLSRGMTPADLDALPVPEVLGRYFVDSWEEATDGMYKWLGLPPAQTLQGLQQWSRDFDKAVTENRVNPLAKLLLPSLSRAVEVGTALDRRIGALRLVESARAYAADKGRLPDRLEDLTLPPPIDPMGLGYTLRREGDTVVIEAMPASARPQTQSRDQIRYELRLRP